MKDYNYNENREEQILLRAGDFIKFVPITLDEFIEIEKNNLSI